ncbi:hypothetical protein [Burkholderia ambifaria]|uniref:hypothetical protein n=1 Tax=Burkholderia ambifaria TaxID=152480 RepID=UPI00158E6CF1|nr:hypothetical protein [Burkholderia ambifaria]
MLALTDSAGVRSRIVDRMQKIKDARATSSWFLGHQPIPAVDQRRNMRRFSSIRLLQHSLYRSAVTYNRLVKPEDRF